ncbi:isopentenyl phosphate kinase [Candidatus Nitrosocosmicus arcticus]|uniref:Isopentenyl phosphate kinase n=1 Tax=Candidatus Nitrosocosmicus arcticus TaxID=2035267 RepID=A0A557SVR8_9ARCH|nr:isopentenyl phosphate kinase [Candidatus Nitrosocosmicus arcticus]TVP40699.1 putative aspartate/glutamate/uridylate kinase [Candidatus Nitrosocosmicus arcticus]
MKSSNLIIIKLGGSVVTFKEKPLTPNYDGIEKILGVLNEIKENFKIIIVHGGGSFGHYWSVKYDMHTKPYPYSDLGVSVVHDSMIELNHIITNKFIESKLKPYSIQPSAFVFNSKADPARIHDIVDMTSGNDLIPITFGDIIHTSGNNFSILSGDTIMSMLCTELHPKFSIFTTNVDGLYSDMSKGEIVREIQVDEADIGNILSEGKEKIEHSDSPFDVTGGMKRKMTESIQIANSGTPVYLINGFHPERILDIIHDRHYIGTCIRMRSGS